VRFFHAAAIEKTVGTFNQYASAKKDPEFGRPDKRMAPLQSPPFYAMELVPSFTNTQGGPRRNKFSQVLDTEGKVIPRLYAGGELGSVCSWYYQAGSNIGECIALGRVAGEKAAAEKAWK
jgi:predicted oxidoreductase